MLAGEPAELSSGAAKALNHWPRISDSLHDLLCCAPDEAVADEMASMARMALQAVEEYDYPPELAQQVRDATHAMLARSSEANRERIAAAIAEPMRLLESIDGFIVRVQQPGNVLPRTEAETQARKFLEWCRQFDQALSAIPIRLRESV